MLGFAGVTAMEVRVNESRRLEHHIHPVIGGIVGLVGEDAVRPIRIDTVATDTPLASACNGGLSTPFVGSN